MRPLIHDDASPGYSLGEEIFHAVSHGVGIVLSLAGLAVLVAFASLRGGATLIVACSVFGACLVLLYAAGRAVWHVFLLLGSVLHLFGVLFYVIPPAR